MTVGVADEVRRRTVDASRLQDDSSMVPYPDGLALEVKTITLRGSHGSLPVDEKPFQQSEPTRAGTQQCAARPGAEPNAEPRAAATNVS